MNYRCLKQQVFEFKQFKIVPIREIDKYDIMKWRNEQIYHLRQSKPLSKYDQKLYFSNVVSKLFDQEKPNQIIFSFLENDECIGYGGLVHINWIDKNAEISFILNTHLEKDHFNEYWSIYLAIIEKLAFDELQFHKIYTFAFDLRPHLYKVLERNNYSNEAILKEHCLFQGKMIDVYIHSKVNSKIHLAPANESDIQLTYSWANDPLVRNHSFNKNFISFENHENWFKSKLSNINCVYYILKKGCNSLGSIRVDIEENHKSGVISYLIDPTVHGKGYGRLILEKFEREMKRTMDFQKLNLIGYVQSTNEPSIKIFRKLDYTESFESPEILKFEKLLIHEN
jgi:RimJ/RimL family protein N-acetyltransferase